MRDGKMLPAWRWRRGGQALVELTLALGILLLLVLGGATAIQVLATHVAVSRAADMAAHEAALLGGSGGLTNGKGYRLEDAPGPIAAIARAALAGQVGVPPEHALISVRCASTPCHRYQPISVRIAYAGQPWLWVPYLRVRADYTSVRAAEQDQP